MQLIAMVGLALGLAMDATAVAIAASGALPRVSARQVFRFSFHFGLFQAGMPVVGWFAGRSISGPLERWDHWVAFALLLLLGGKSIFEALRGRDGTPAVRTDPTRGASLVALSVATSIDALAVGLTLPLISATPVGEAAVIIGIVTFAICFAGVYIGHHAGHFFEAKMEVIGGLALIGIGTKILVEHLVQ